MSYPDLRSQLRCTNAVQKFTVFRNSCNFVVSLRFLKCVRIEKPYPCSKKLADQIVATMDISVCLSC